MNPPFLTSSELLAISPLIVVMADVVAVVLLLAFYRNHVLTMGITTLGLALAVALLPVAYSVTARFVTPLVVIDGYAIFFMGLVFITAIAVAVLMYGYLERMEKPREEDYILLLMATFGSAVLVASNHFASFFLGLEILSVSLYTMIAYPRLRDESIEAGIKYLVLAGSSAAMLVFGMALVYAELGTLDFATMASGGISAAGVSTAVLVAGLGLIIVGVGYKLAVVPFHLWTPDVYQGSPAPATAFIATVSKGAVFAVFLRFFVAVSIRDRGALFLAVVFIAVASMLVGNLLALRQSNVKRILAYSSIAQLGYLLVAFLAGGAFGPVAAAFYLVAYFITTIGAFGVVAALSTRERDADRMEDYRGLFWRRPWLAGGFTAMLLSLAGLPLTAGFIGKFFLVTAGVGTALWALVVTLVVASAIGLYYYLRITVAMYRRPEVEGEAGVRQPSVPLAGGVVLVTMAGLLIWLGIYPTPLLDLIYSTVGRLLS